MEKFFYSSCLFCVFGMGDFSYAVLFFGRKEVRE